MKYEIYGRLHKFTKKILGRFPVPMYRMISIPENSFSKDNTINVADAPFVEYFNELNPSPNILHKKDIYPVENIVPLQTFVSYQDSFTSSNKYKKNNYGIHLDKSEDIWMRFIKNSKIDGGYRNSGLHYAGYILEDNEWCLPSWVWTNAAIVRMYCSLGKIELAKNIADILLKQQQEGGGWIVRNDYNKHGAIPVLAPNDSAYIANNACLELYYHTNDEKYLTSARKCADWIMDTARNDGMVYSGYDVKKKYWQAKHNIVDVGFTAGLFSRLYECCKEKKYLEFLKKFTERYIELFYISEKNGFATSLDEHDQKMGGMFGRGQAWALEGLIPASRVLHDSEINQIIENTINMLIHKQDRNGGWAYNITRPLMGIDCKATSVIACSLMNWYQQGHKRKEIEQSAIKALNWCLKNTLNDGIAEGGIFSYTVEGAIVHHLYTRTAFVYGSSYAIELKQKLLTEKLI